MQAIEEILKIDDASEVVRLLTTTKPHFTESIDEINRQWEVQLHDVMDSTRRKKKTVRVPTGERDHKTGKLVYKEKKIERCRIAVPIQQVLVRRAAGFLFSNPVRYAMTAGESEQAQQLYAEVMRIFAQNKLKYKDKKLARTLMHEREVAELWYYEFDANGEPQRMRMKLLVPSEGNKLYPHFDDWGNMDGFAREYYTIAEDAKTTRHFDVYTSRYVVRYVYDSSKPQLLTKPQLHGFTKVPVIYYRQEHAEWHNVQPAISRVENLLSNWADTNDYFGKPAYVAKGDILGFAEKGETGSIYQLSADADMKVLSWDNSPESIRNELATLLNIIFSYSQIPDVSFETMKQLGNNTSGVAIQLMFTDPHMHAEDRIEMFGEMFQRRYNLVQNGVVTLLKNIPERVIDEIEVEPKFEPYMPKNLTETLQLLNMSTGGKPSMSQQEAVRQNPLVDNADATLKQIQEEAAAEAQSAMVTSLFGTASGEE
jgi:SPP1 family phage portal protein